MSITNVERSFKEVFLISSNPMFDKEQGYDYCDMAYLPRPGCNGVTAVNRVPPHASGP